LLKFYSQFPLASQTAAFVALEGLIAERTNFIAEMEALALDLGHLGHLKVQLNCRRQGLTTSVLVMGRVAEVFVHPVGVAFCADIITGVVAFAFYARGPGRVG